MNRAVEIAVLDMAGTTVRDEGSVEAAFVSAAEAVGATVDGPMLEFVRATMGQSKIDVFTQLFGDPERAAAANKAFEQAYAGRVAAGGCTPVPGAELAISALRDAGVRVALTTGFSGETQRLLVEALGWRSLIDLCLAPADAGRGRPYPDLPLQALLRLGGSRVQALLVAGDTTSDMRCGGNAGAGLVVGVLTGTQDEPALRAAGANHVLPSIADLPELLGI
ncbi:MAG TPA: phosphonatase-like hydrolase [Rugosimonospora sp.]|nr:phosphonatase-like hydrolase [Rugosimonospora sp.]